MLLDAPTREPAKLASELRAHQRTGADNVLNEFAMGHERVLVVMPCGTGKTHMAVHIVHEHAPHGRALTLAPTLELLNQTARVWYTCGRPGRYLGLCSDEQTSEPILNEVLTMTGDPARLADLVRTADGPVNVFATYASLPKLVEAHRVHLLPRWDVAVVDEAHRTAGARDKPWAAIHDNTAVPARHRLYLTATPRVWDAGSPLTVEPIASMDDIDLFGPVVYRYSLAQAISDGQLADYRIAAIEVYQDDLRTVLAGHTRAGRTPAADAMRMTASQVALCKAREDHGIRRAVAFCRSTAQADVFADTLPDTARRLPGNHAEGLWATSIHSHHTRRARRASVERFARPTTTPAGRLADLDVLSNVRLLTEGVDFPFADAVLFVDPKHSTCDIMQSVGRALRITPGANKCATLIVPVFFSPGQRPENAARGTPYHLLMKVMLALDTYDEHFFHRISLSSTAPLLKPPPANTARPERAEEIAPHLMLRIMEPEPEAWEKGLAAAQDFHRRHGHLDVPSNHLDDDGFHLGCWLGYQRARKAADNLPATRVAQLTACAVTWQHPLDSTEARLTLALAYASEHGHLHPEDDETYQGQPLGAWLAGQRAKARNATLPRPYRHALKDIDPWWNPAWPHNWQRSCSRLRARAREVPLAIPITTPPDDADPLTHWLDEQYDLFPTLMHGQQRQLTALLRHDVLAPALRPTRDGSPAHTHAQGLRAARRYYRTHHHLRVPLGHHEPTSQGDSFPLGRWIARLRRQAADNLLTREEVSSIEALPMEWIPGLTARNAPAILTSGP
ncbi:Helicase associated domain protein [Kitasatospora sp. NPDC036755]|uniref:DEAD/DEAH box helicase n=1 Tax=Kitasatospora sp. NPDC036755 TaxID=3154600 RepID=UPI00340B0962